MRTLLYSIIFVFITSCSNSKKEERKKMQEQSDILLHDTSITTKSSEAVLDNENIEYCLVIQGKKHQLIIPQRRIDYFDELQNFIDLYGKHMIFHHEYFTDVTGDGLKNKCITNVEKKNKGYLATNMIYQGRDLIWHDTLHVRREKIDFFWSETPDLFNQLEEWLLFFEAYRSASHFTEDFHSFSEYNNLWEMYINSLAVTGDSEDEILEYLRSFKGQAIKKMCIWAPSVSIWHPKVNDFIEIYAP